VSFTVDGKTPERVARALAEKNIGIANGNCYAYRLMEAMKIEPEQGVVRVSFVHYTSDKEMDILLDRLHQLT
jgi:selenocysteine lyase/cysteine desulfurase